MTFDNIFMLLTALEPSVKLEYAKQKWDKSSYDKGVAALEKAVRHILGGYFQLRCSQFVKSLICTMFRPHHFPHNLDLLQVRNLLCCAQ